MLSPCSDCGLRPRYLVNGKWSTLEKINTLRISPSKITVRPQHSRRCSSFDAAYQRFSKAASRAPRARGRSPQAFAPLPNGGLW